MADPRMDLQEPRAGAPAVANPDVRGGAPPATPVTPALSREAAATLEAAFAAQRAAFAREPCPAREQRLDRLARLEALIERNEPAIVAAVAADFGTRSAQETRLTELFVVRAGLRHARRHLATWMRPRRVPTPVYLWPGRSRVERQPRGVVGVISPWNYPVQLALLPLVAALAAGNRAMLKPSELTPCTSALLQSLVSASFAPDELVVINGDADMGKAFAALPFDHLFFTGSTAVGRDIAMAAARNLTPVTLELGGKSPVLVLPGADLELVARRLAAGKFLNAGQTCIAPDYVLAPAAQVEALGAAIVGAARALYPGGVDSADYTGIVNDAHMRRLTGLIDDARRQGARVLGAAAAGAGANRRKLPPTVIVGATPDMAVMREEIFGPVLPLEAYADIDEALARINARPRPLALYLFGGDAGAWREVLARTHAGGVTENDVLWHFCNEALPFGGVGASGIGAYHGESGFLAFSHQKSVFTQSRFALTPLLSPPFGKVFEALLNVLKRLS